MINFYYISPNIDFANLLLFNKLHVGGSSILGFPVGDVESSDDENDIVNAG